MSAARGHEATGGMGEAIVALVDELAALAASLWVEGKLDQFPASDAEPLDVDEE